MKSKFTIEIDWQQPRPVIRVVECLNSDDMRDQALAQFRREFMQESKWCRVHFGEPQMDGTMMWFIEPVRPKELQEEIKGMQEVVVGHK